MSKVIFKESRYVTTDHEVNLTEPHWWKVHTEGDVEGRTIRDLGHHHGTLQEVAAKLSGACSWVLSFRWVNPNEMSPDHGKRDNVTISVEGISSDVLYPALTRAGVKVVGSNPNGVILKLR